MGSRRLILIVDDNKENLRLLTQMLKDDYQIALANNGQKALDVVAKRKVDLILLDVMMPQINGFEICKMLKSKQETEDSTVIFISALKDADKKLQAFDVGGVDYIVKPFHKKEVLARIKRQIELIETREKLERKNQEQKKLLNSLKISEKKFRSYIDYAPDGIFIVNKAGDYIDVNKEAVKMTGYKKDEFLDMNIRDLIPKEELEKSLNAFQKLLKEGQIKVEIKLKKKDKKLIDVILEARKISDNRFLSFKKNITEKKKMENSLRRRIKLESLSRELSKNFIDLKEENVVSKIEQGLEKIGRFMEVDYAYIYLLSDNKKKITETFNWYQEDFKNKDLAKERVAFGLKNLPWLLNKLETEELIDLCELDKLPQEAQNLKDILWSQGIKSTLIFPLRYANDLIGGLAFDSKRKRDWNKQELSLFRVIADIFVNALQRKKNEAMINEYYTELEMQNMELESLYSDLESEFEKAKQLHQQFLPSNLPEIEGISYDSYFEPSKKLGGDFYDILLIDNKLLFYLADVSGHGLDGSMMNIFLRETINNSLLNNNNGVSKLKPSKLISQVADRYRNENFPADYFICLLVGVLDLDTMDVTFANAGFQFPPLSVKNNGQLSVLDSIGMPISSAFSESMFIELYMSDYEEEKITLEKGDTLFLTTDGLIEEIVDGEMYGEERLREVLAQNYEFPASLINSMVKDSFNDFSGSLVSQDDLTFLTLKRDLEIIDKFEETIKSSIEQMHQVQEKAEKFVADYYDLPSLICIGFQEIITNAIEHGNKMDFNKEIKIEIEVTEKHIKTIITDQGEGFDWKSKINKELDIENDLENERERGKGIKISNKSYDKIWYNEKGNQAYLFKLLLD